MTERRTTRVRRPAPTTMPAPVRHWSLFVVVILFLGLVFIYGRVIPPFEGPDEPEHFAYIEWLIRDFSFPPQGEAAWETPVRQEGSQPPLYYLVASLPGQLSGVDTPPAGFDPNPHFPSSAPGTLDDNKNVAIQPLTSPSLEGGWLAFYGARLVSALFGVLLLVMTYGLAWEAGGNRPVLASIATLLVAVTPQVIFQSSIVSNDIAAAAFSTGALWLLIRLVKRGVTARRLILLGLLYGLAILTKTSALALGIPIFVGLCWLLLQARHADTNHPVLNRKPWSQLPVTLPAPLRLGLVAAVFSGVTTLIVAGWWYLRSLFVYGSLFGLDTHYYAPWSLSNGQTRPSVWAQWREVFDSYWAAFGWGNIKFPSWLYLMIVVLILVAMFGWLVGLIQWLRQAERKAEPVVVVTLLGMTAVLMMAALEAWMQRVIAPHGRLLFPAVGAIAVLIAWGWFQLNNRLVWGAWGPIAALAVLAPLFLLAPAYDLPRVLSANQVDRLEAMNWRFGEVATLVHVEAEEDSVPAGSSLPIRVCWQPLAQTEQNYSVLIHIVGPNQSVVASRRTYPGLGTYPTSQWEVGAVFCDTIRVDIPADLSQTLQYDIEIGLVDNATNERLPIVDGNGATVAYAKAEAVRLEAMAAEDDGGGRGDR